MTRSDWAVWGQYFNRARDRTLAFGSGKILFITGVFKSGC